jgi:hypothetical protein
VTAASPRRSRACLDHARLPARLDSERRIVTLDRRDRGVWDTRGIAEGVRVVQSALAVKHPGWVTTSRTGERRSRRAPNGQVSKIGTSDSRQRRARLRV